MMQFGEGLRGFKRANIASANVADTSPSLGLVINGVVANLPTDWVAIAVVVPSFRILNEVLAADLA
jgi:hypothetical protein